MVELLAVETEDVEVDVFGSDPTDVDVWGEFSSNGAGAASGAWSGFDKDFQENGDEEGTARTEDTCTSHSSRGTAQSNSLFVKRGSGHQKRLSKHIVPSTIHRNSKEQSDADDSTLSEKSLRSKSSHSTHSTGSGQQRSRQRSRRNLISKHSNSNRNHGHGAPPRLERVPSQSSFKRSGSMKRDSSHRESPSKSKKQPDSAEMVRRTQSLCVSSIQSRGENQLRRGHRRTGSGRSGAERRSSSSRNKSLLQTTSPEQAPRRLSSLRGGARMDPYRHAMESDDDDMVEEDAMETRRPLTRKASRGPSKSRRDSTGGGVRRPSSLVSSGGSSSIRRPSSLVSSGGSSSGVRRSSSLVSSGGGDKSEKQCRSGGRRPLQRKPSITPCNDHPSSLQRRSSLQRKPSLTPNGIPSLQRRNSRRIDACRF